MPEVLLARIAELEAELRKRDQALGELALREEQFRMIAENVREVIFLRDPHTPRFLYVNPAFEEFWGMSRQELNDNPEAFLRAIVPEDRPRVLEVFRTLRGSCRVEYRMQVGTQPVRWVSARAFPVLNAAGDVRYLVGLSEDVTERKRRELSQEARMQLMVETAFEGVLTVDAAGVVTYANARIDQLLGFSRGEIIGMLGTALLQPSDAAGLPARLARRAQGLSENIELTLLHKNGSPVEVRIAVSPLFEGGIFVGALSMVTDVTERNRTERQLRASLAEKEVLLREVHHRVKNNLQIVSSLLSLQANTVKDEAARVALEESRERIQSIALAHELLYRSDDLAKVDFRAYLRELVSVVATPFIGPEVSIELELEEEPLELPLDVTVSSGLLVNELLTNALRHAFPDGQRGRVTVSCHRNGGTCVLVVADDGVGTPVEARTGQPQTLGLRLVSTLVRQLGGTMDVQVACGSRVTIRFPFPEPPTVPKDN